MKKILLSTLLSAGILLSANSDYPHEVSLLLGGALTEGNLELERNYANIGLSIGTKLDSTIFDQIEFGILKSIQDVDIKNSTEDTSVLRVFTNVIKDYPINDTSSFYALVGIGVESFSNSSRNEDGLFANYGLGYKYKFTDRTSLKMDLRHLIEADHGDNNLLYTVGLSYGFGQKANKMPVMMKKEEPIMKEEPMVQKMKDVYKDDDNDGVFNRHDECLNTPLNTRVSIDGCAKVMNLKVNFNTDSDVMNKDYSEVLKNFALYLNASKKSGVIAAHTDSRGSEAYNLILSDKRAKAVHDKLVNLGVNASKLMSKGFGESKPVASNQTKEGRLANRRVEAILSK